MKTLQSLTAAAAVSMLLLASCGKGEVKAGEVLENAKAAIADFDLSAAPEKLAESVTGFAGDLTSKLGEVTDIESAKDLVAKFGPVVDKLKQVKTTLGDKMPDMASLKQAAEGVMTKFKDNEGIMNVLKPMLDKLMAMFQ